MPNNIDNYNFLDMEYQYFYNPSLNKEDKKIFYKNLIFSNQWYGTYFEDGVNCKIIKNNEGKNYILTNNSINYIDYFPQFKEYFDTLKNGSCLIGILYLKNQPSEKVNYILNNTIKNALKFQENQKIELYLYDVIAYNGNSWINHRASNRLDKLRSLGKKYNTSYIKHAVYLRGKYFWDEYQHLTFYSKETFILLNGYEKYQPTSKSKNIAIKLDASLQLKIKGIIIGMVSSIKTYTGDLMKWTYWRNIRTGELLNENKYDEYYDGAPYEPITVDYYNGVASKIKIGLNKNGKIFSVGTVDAPREFLVNWREKIGTTVEICNLQINGDIIERGTISREINCRKKDCVMEQLYE